VAGGLAEPVIERNTPVPIEQSRRFTTFQDFQESVKIRVYQGDSRTADENEMLGQFEFSGFAKARRGEVNIDVTFEINADGIVNVTAADPATGQAASTSITLSGGLSAEDMQKILDHNPTARVATAEAPKRASKPAARAAAARTGAPRPAAPVPPPGPDDEIVLLDETADELEIDDGDLEIISDDLEALAAENPGAAVSPELDPNAVSIPELDGDPEDLVPMGDAAVEVNEAEDREDLFDSNNMDLSADDDEIELE
jgi:hypothetical protein